MRKGCQRYFLPNFLTYNGDFSPHNSIYVFRSPPPLGGETMCLNRWGLEVRK